MNSQQLFWIYLVGGLVLLLFFLAGRKGSKAPTKLNLRAKSSEPPQAPSAERSLHGLSSSQLLLGSTNSHSKKPELLEAEPQGAANQGKNLNVIFMYNGHDWDAYQVLGVTPGTPLPLITQKFQEALREGDPTTFEFLELAYKAILDSTKGHRL